MRAIWNSEIIAESDDTVIVEGNHYFPVEPVRLELLEPTPTHTRCYWKGTASYYSIKVDEKVNPDAAWCYPDPSPAAAAIKDRIAFWRGVKVERGRVGGRAVAVPEDASCEVVSSSEPRGLGRLVRRMVGR